MHDVPGASRDSIPCKPAHSCRKKTDELMIYCPDGFVGSKTMSRNAGVSLKACLC